VQVWCHRAEGLAAHDGDVRRRSARPGGGPEHGLRDRHGDLRVVELAVPVIDQQQDRADALLLRGDQVGVDAVHPQHQHREEAVPERVVDALVAIELDGEPLRRRALARRRVGGGAQPVEVEADVAPRSLRAGSLPASPRWSMKMSRRITT
jgi:hypothetical protein